MKICKSLKKIASLKTLLIAALLVCSGTSFAETSPKEITVNSNTFGYQSVVTVDYGEQLITQVKNTKTNEIIFYNKHDKEKGIDDIASARELLKLEKLDTSNNDLADDRKKENSISEAKTVKCYYTHTNFGLGIVVTHNFICDNGGSVTIDVYGSQSWVTIHAP